ncbi:hypothetical protein QTP86_005044 [Hemibagrus guttatus]|nr:hypothetical protein QTP86_005044 [Hemibagrus guttatus]
MWKGIKTITDYKSSTPLTSHDATLPDALNEFFACFDNQTSQMDTQTTSLPRDELVIILESHQVRSTMRKIDITKAAGPDRVPGHTLKSCADQPAGVFTNIFNLSLQQALVPTCLKSTTIVRVPKKQQASIPTDLDRHQFAYCGNRSTEDVISTALHTSLYHLEHPNTYVRMLFVDFSSAFNTIVPHKLVDKLNNLGLTKFLGLHITKDLTWTINTTYLVKKAQQRLFFLRKLKKAKVPYQLLVNIYRSTIESILCPCITVWYTSCTTENRRHLARIIKAAQKIVGTKLPNLEMVYASQLHNRASNIIKDPTHPGHRLFVPLPSGKRYRTIKTRTNRLRNSFFPRVVTCIVENGPVT